MSIHKTIANLRELAGYAALWDEGFEMGNYCETDEGDELHPNEIEECYECGTTCCLIGIAATFGMGEPEEFDHWDYYSDSIFPTILHTTNEWGNLFGPHLESNLSDRIAALREFADELEEDYSE